MIILSDIYLTNTIAVLDDKMREEIKRIVKDEVRKAMDSELDMLKSTTQAQARKNFELEHKVESYAGTVDAVQSKQLEMARSIRNITFQLMKQSPRR